MDESRALDQLPDSASLLAEVAEIGQELASMRDIQTALAALVVLEEEIAENDRIWEAKHLQATAMRAQIVEACGSFGVGRIAFAGGSASIVNRTTPKITDEQALAGYLLANDSEQAGRYFRVRTEIDLATVKERFGKLVLPGLEQRETRSLRITKQAAAPEEPPAAPDDSVPF